jgi:hypothetical protein
MSCPNCGAYGWCLCTWDEQAKAASILRRRAAELRRKAGRPSVVEEEAQCKAAEAAKGKD